MKSHLALRMFVFVLVTVALLILAVFALTWPGTQLSYGQALTSPLPAFTPSYFNYLPIIACETCPTVTPTPRGTLPAPSETPTPTVRPTLPGVNR